MINEGYRHVHTWQVAVNKELEIDFLLFKNLARL